MQPISRSVVGNFDVIVYQDEAATGLMIETLRSLNAPEGAEHVPSKVTNKKGEILWRYDKYRFPGAFAWLREVGDDGEPVIIYVDRGQVYEVIPVRDLPHRRPVRDAKGFETHEGGRGLQLLVELKLFLAKDAGLQPALTPIEAALAQVVSKRLAAEREAAQAEARARREAAKEVRQRERDERIAAIMARRLIVVYAADGMRLSGIPVVGDEWHVLPRYKWVVLVDAYDAESKTAGNPIEHFQVYKSEGGRVEKANARQVTTTNPMESKPVATMRGQALIEIKGEVVSISLYDRSGVNALHADGLNGGTRVGVLPANPDGSITVYEVTTKAVREFGRFKPEFITQ